MKNDDLSAEIKKLERMLRELQERVQKQSGPQLRKNMKRIAKLTEAIEEFRDMISVESANSNRGGQHAVDLIRASIARDCKYLPVSQASGFLDQAKSETRTNELIKIHNRITNSHPARKRDYVTDLLHKKRQLLNLMAKL
ncbi:MAG: hypothetical protein VYA55_22640 [Pseudomonadota bacterium]|nr:hypothetical protein [Pseudomonadota bacterium]